jgi:hypothetical protein
VWVPLFISEQLLSEHLSRCDNVGVLCARVCAIVCGPYLRESKQNAHTTKSIMIIIKQAVYSEIAFDEFL